MLKKDEGLDLLLKRVSVAINKSPEDLEPFFKILKQNWYDSQQSLLKLTPQDYQKMKIPHRVSQAIIQQLPKSRTPSYDHTPNEPYFQPPSTSTSKPKLTQSSMLQLTNSLSQKLLAKLKGNKYQTRSVLQILYKIISNIVKDSYEMKFRTLKKSNNMIQQNVMQHEPCLQFMAGIGFEDCGDTLELRKFQIPQFIFLQDCLNQLIVGLGGMPQNANKKPQNQQKMFLDITKFPTTDSQLKQQFSQQNLKQVKYIDALQHLIQIRNKMMSQPPKNRRLRIYHKRLQTKPPQISQISFQHQFQNSHQPQVATYWKQLIESNTKSQSFQSKRKLQFQYLLSQKIHRETLIKVKLPNQLIIEAYFGPLEKLRDVFTLVAKIVIGDLYLFTAPPRKIMDGRDLDKTLIEIQAVPMGSFYLGTNTEYYIQGEYAGMIQQ